MTSANARTTPSDVEVGDLATLVESWTISLRASNRAPKTLATYLEAADQLIAFLRAAGMPTAALNVHREHVKVLRRRANAAGIEGGLHAHQLRHTFAHLSLVDGMSEGDLMRLGGWRSRQMLDRYGASAADERA